MAALGRYDEAIPVDKAAQKVRDHPGIRRNLVLAYHKSGRLSEAISELAVLRHEQRDNLDLALLLADYYFRLGEEAKVIELLEPIASGTPENLALAYLLGTAYIRQGQARKGQVLIDKLLGRGKSAEAHLLLGVAHERAAGLEAAAVEFEKSVAPGRGAAIHRARGRITTEIRQSSISVGQPVFAAQAQRGCGACARESGG